MDCSPLELPPVGGTLLGDPWLRPTVPELLRADSTATSAAYDVMPGDPHALGRAGSLSSLPSSDPSMFLGTDDRGGGYGQYYSFAGQNRSDSSRHGGVDVGALAELSLTSDCAPAAGGTVGYNHWGAMSLHPLPQQQKQNPVVPEAPQRQSDQRGNYHVMAMPKAASRLGPLSVPDSRTATHSGDYAAAGMWIPTPSGRTDSTGLSEGNSLDTTGDGQLSLKRKASEDPDLQLVDRKLRQKLKKREAARRRYHQQQQRLTDLKMKVESAKHRNEDLNNKLVELLEEQNALTAKERELVEKQKRARAEIEALRAEYKSLTGSKS